MLNPLRTTGPRWLVPGLLVALTACGGGGADTTANTASPAAPTPTAPLVRYDFAAGDSLAAKDGWRFHQNWALAQVPGTSTTALPFAYRATPDGVYPNNAEMRFDMPPQDALWLRLRLHLPANYEMRHNTELGIAGAATAGWKAGDTLLAHDGLSRGQVSSVTDERVFVRWAEKAGYDIWGSATALRQIRNLTNQTVLQSTSKSVWGGDKLLALWVDQYSQAGWGPTIILGMQSDWTFGSTRDAMLTLAYRNSGSPEDSSRINVGGILGGSLFKQAHRGKYIDLAMHVRYSTAAGAKDGQLQTWVRYEGETTFTPRHDIRNANLDRPANLAGDLQKWQRGYLMGFSNSGYDEPTTFHISRIELFSARPADLP